MIRYELQKFGGRGTTSANGTTQSILSIPPSPTTSAASKANKKTFSDTDTSDFHQLYNGRQYFLDQNLTIDQQLAVMNYISPTPESGSLYSMSQNMNNNLAKGKKLTANQQYVYDNIMGTMHNLGYNLTLTRYDHSDMVNSLLQNVGITGGMQGMNEKQLKKALVGMEYKENRLLSTSYNDFKNAGGSASSFTSREVKISYKAKASVQAMMPGDGPGGSFGEVIAAPNQKQKIVDVRFTGKKARSKGTQMYNLNQVEVVVELG